MVVAYVDMVTVTALLLEAAGYDIIMSVSLPLSIVFRRR